MKTITAFRFALGALALFFGLSASAQAAEPGRNNDLKVWIDPKLGSHIGGGYASSYLTNIRARTIEREDPKLRQAIEGLEELGMLPVKGFGLVPAAVSWQTETPIHVLVQEQAETNLSYGELLIAHSLGAKSGKSLGEIVALRNRSGSWGDLAKELQVDPDMLVTRANVAASRIRLVEFRMRRRPLREGGTNYTSVNPHTQSARLR